MCAVLRFCLAGVLSASALVVPSGASYGTPPQLPVWRQQLEVAASAKDELASVQITDEIYRKTLPTLKDLQLFAADGAPTPFVVRTQSEVQMRSEPMPWNAKIAKATLDDDSTLEIIIDLESSDPAPYRMTVQTPLRNFEHRVQVFVPDGADNWRMVKKDGLIFDYSQFVDVRGVDVALPVGDARRLRILFDAPVQEQRAQLVEIQRNLQGSEETGRSETATINLQPFRIDAIRLWGNSAPTRSETHVHRGYPATGLKITQNASQQATVVEFDAPAAPLTSVVVETPERNFSRHVVLEAADRPGSWKTIAQQNLVRLDFPELQQDARTVSFPATRAKQYRLSVFNRDSPPLDIQNVRLGGLSEELVFLPQSSNVYSLCFRGGPIRELHLDTAPIEAVLKRHYQPVPVRLVGEAERTYLDDSADAATTEAWYTRPTVLFGAVIFLVVLLGVALYQAARRVDQTTVN